MKNLRKSNPLLKALQNQLSSPADTWNNLDQAAQIELCLQFLALPLLKKTGEISLAIRQVLAPSATDLAPQVSQLYREMPHQFVKLQDLLEKTTSLFVIAQEDEA